jgi:hypothetical protein
MLLNSKGISVLFLIIAMLMMVTIGYVLSYLIPTKQKSVLFPISSSQAFFIAQSGVEYGVRYATDHGWTTPASLAGLNGPGINQRNLGRGGFTITYDAAADKLTSTGVVPNAGQRTIIVSSFTSFVSPSILILDPGSPSPCWTTPNQTARFFMKNVSSSSITLTDFYATWTESTSTRIRTVAMDGVQKFFGNYRNGDPTQSFNRGGNSQTVLPNQVIQVDVNWFSNTVTGNIVMIFYSATGNYNLNLGSTLSNC